VLGHLGHGVGVGGHRQERVAAHERRLPGVGQLHGGVAEPGLAERPVQCGLGGVGAVGPDDDALDADGRDGGGAHDRYRAGGVVQALLADRARQQAVEAAEPAGTDDQ